MTYNICVSELIVSASATSLTPGRGYGEDAMRDTIWRDPQSSIVWCWCQCCLYLLPTSPGARNCSQILYQCRQMTFVDLFAVNWFENGASCCSTVVKFLTWLSTSVGSSPIYGSLNIQHWLFSERFEQCWALSGTITKVLQKSSFVTGTVPDCISPRGARPPPDADECREVSTLILPTRNY